jgi:excinuclease UvrABC nuclease subunit
VPGCLRHEVGGCAGPCIGGGEGAEYARRVAEVRDFLASRTTAPLDTLRRRMADAAAALQFERAGAIKLRLAGLEWLAERLARFHANVDRLTFTYSIVGHGGEGRVYLVRRGTVRAELPTPVTDADREALAALERRVFEGPDPRGRDIPIHDLDELYLVSSWFRRRPSELAATAAR